MSLLAPDLETRIAAVSSKVAILADRNLSRGFEPGTIGLIPNLIVKNELSVRRASRSITNIFVFSAKPCLDYLLSTSDCGMAMVGTCKGGLRTKHVR